jgi:hypothetical protein
MIINRDQTAGVPLPDLALNVGKTSIRPGNGHEWDAVIIRRRHRLYKIKISRRAYIGGSLQMSDDVYVQPGPIRYAITLGGARWQAQRMVQRRNRRDALDVPIARTIEVRPRAWS